MKKIHLRYVFADTDEEKITGRGALVNLGAAAAVCLAATAISLMLGNARIGKENLFMIFLIGVLFAAIVTPGYIYGFLTSVASLFICNYLFTEPKYSLHIDDREDILLLVSFLLTALIGGYLSARSHRQAAIARQNERNAQQLYEERNKIALAIESERLKSTLLRSISHDIRTPLTGIMGASSAIAESSASLDENTVRSLARDINEESARLMATVQNILDMTRVTEGNLSLKKTLEAVDDLVTQVMSRVPFLTGGNRFKVQMPEEIVLVEVDGKLFVQVLFNLLDNAYKHAGDDVPITLSVRAAGENVIFEISDEGKGIDESIQDSLFEGFVTLPGYLPDKGRGVGLGLSICKAIVTAHNGEITAGNRPGGGARFTIALPWKREG